MRNFIFLNRDLNKWLKFFSFLIVTLIATPLRSQCKQLPHSYLEHAGISPFKKNTSKSDANLFVLKNKRNDTFHALWVEFDKYKSKNKKDSSFVFYSSSNDSGKTWKEPKRISHFAGDCADSDGTLKGANLCFGSDSSIYATWASPGGLAFQLSKDDGKTWLKQEKIINPIVNGWDYKINKIHSNGLPIVAFSKNSKIDANRIYISWGDEKYGNANKDIFLVYSDDMGENWTEPILVSYHPNHKERFFPKLAVDTSNGFVYLLYYDQQNTLDKNSADIYIALSKNGGLKFEYFKLTSQAIGIKPYSFSEHALEFSSEKNILYANWKAVSKKEICFFSVPLADSVFAKYEKKTAEIKNTLSLDKTFTYSERIAINFTISSSKEISAVITKPLEPAFEKVLFKNKSFGKGEHSFLINSKSINLKKGNYVITLYYSGENKFAWIIEE